MALFVSAADAAPINPNKSRAKQMDRTNGFVFMASSSRELNLASMFFQTCQQPAFRFPGRVELVIMDLEHDYENEHEHEREKATSEFGVPPLPRLRRDE